MGVLRRQWTSLVLLGTGWALLVGAVRLEQASDELAGVTIGAAVLLVLVGALHHRGLKAAWAGASASVELPPAPPATGEVTERIAEADELPQVTSEHEADDATRYLLADDLLERFVLEPGPPLEDCRGQVWLYDEERRDLYGILQPGHPDLVRFRVGEGTVGQCWAQQDFVVAEPGKALSPEFGLDDEKLARYADLVAAAAVPITNAAGEMLGVLGMSSRSSDTQLGSDDALEQMVFLAEVAARVLVDLFEWFDDGTVGAEEEA